jgi:uncharacterized protein (TIGR02099 family)
MKAIANLIKHSTATLILLLGLIAGLGYLLGYAAERNQDRFADWLAGYLGLEVRFDRLTVDWQLFDPSLRLDGVEVGAPTDPVRLARAEVGFELRGIFGASGPLRVGIYGAHFHVIREVTGQVRITGLPEFNTQATRGPAHRQVRLQLIDASITWEDRKYQRQPLTFASVSGSLWGTTGEWRLAAQVRSEYGNLVFAGSLQGDPTGPDWGGYTKVSASGLDLAELVGGYFPAHYRLRSARVDGELQLFWQAARISASTGAVMASDIHLIGDNPLLLDRLTTAFHFDRQNDGWRLALEELTMERAGRRRPASRLEMEWKAPAAGGRELVVAADYLRLEDLVALALVRAPQSMRLPLVPHLQPSGDLRDLRLRLRLGGATPDWQLAARFEELNLQRSGNVPGIERLRGELRTDGQHVQVEFAAHDTRLDFGPLLGRPIDISDLTGQLDWQKVGASGWQLRSDGLHIATPDLTTQTRLIVTNIQTDPLYLDIQTGFQDVDAARISAYYPSDVMPVRLVDWLKRAIVGGTLTGGTMVLRGPAADFPFDQTRNGHFEVLFGVRDLILDYQPRWPRLEEMTAEVRFHNNDLEILVESAKIYDSDVQDLTAHIRQLRPVTPVEIRGEVRGPLADELRLLSESPLAADFGNLVDGLHAGGQAKLNLDMAVPLGKIGDYRLKGGLQFLDNRLTLIDWQLPLSNIEGTLDFDLESIRAAGIKARGLGTQLTVGVAPGKDGTTLVSATGRIDAGAIQDELPALPLDKASGRSTFTMRLEIPNLQAPPEATTWLDIRSDLEGMALDLPAPLGKRPTEARPWHIRVPVSGRARSARLRYADLLDAVFDLSGQRGQIRFGGATATWPAANEFAVVGHIPRLEVDPWVATFQESYAALARSTTSASFRIDLTFGDVLAAGLSASDLRLLLRNEPQAWRGELDSPQIAGRFSVPKSWPAGELAIELERLTLNFDPTTEQDAPASSEPSAAADPRDWPSIDFRCRALKANNVNLTDVELQMVRSTEGLTGKRLRFAGKLATFDGVLTWEAAARSNRSLLNGRLTTPSLGKLLNRLGYAPQLTDTPADVEFDLRWPAAPLKIDRRHLSGHIGLDLGAGRVLDFDPGVTRVVGLLNLSALQRRLRLDFSDLYKRGLSFDEISGNFTLDSGDAYTNDFRLQGPTGTIEIAGRTGIEAEDFDQLVSVTPKLDATLPLAGTIAGGPIAGLATLVAQQLMRKQVDRINRFQYSVKGPWASPTIVALSSGGTLSKIFGAGQAVRDIDGIQDPVATSERSAVKPPSDGQPALKPGAQTENGDPGIDQGAVMDQPGGSLLDQLLDNLAPTGSGREILDAAD